MQWCCVVLPAKIGWFYLDGQTRSVGFHLLLRPDVSGFLLGVGRKASVDYDVMRFSGLNFHLSFCIRSFNRRFPAAHHLTAPLPRRAHAPPRAFHALRARRALPAALPLLR
jgi:hypothetical protein